MWSLLPGFFFSPVFFSMRFLIFLRSNFSSAFKFKSEASSWTSSSYIMKLINQLSKSTLKKSARANCFSSFCDASSRFSLWLERTFCIYLLAFKKKQVIRSVCMLPVIIFLVKSYSTKIEIQKEKPRNLKRTMIVMFSHCFGFVTCLEAPSFEIRSGRGLKTIKSSFISPCRCSVKNWECFLFSFLRHLLEE